jgi:hypothetical protein
VIRSNEGSQALKLYTHSLQQERKERKAIMLDGSNRPFYLPIGLRLSAQEFLARLQRASSDQLVQVCNVLRWHGVLDPFCGVAADDMRRKAGVVNSSLWANGAPIMPALRGMGLASYFYYFGDSKRLLCKDADDPKVDPLVLEWE